MRSIAAFVLLLAGCGSYEPFGPRDTGTPGEQTKVAPAPTSDAAIADAPGHDAIVETAPPPEDTYVAPVCDDTVPTGFMCPSVVPPVPSTVCSESMLQALVSTCFDSTWSMRPECAGWKTAFPACAKCVADYSASYLPGEVFPDRDKCMWTQMDPGCRNATACTYACQDAVCAACSTDEFSGKYEDSTEYEDCALAAIGGKCKPFGGERIRECLYSIDATVCAITFDSPFGPNTTEILEFYRGACRDGGDWTNARTAP